MEDKLSVGMPKALSLAPSTTFFKLQSSQHLPESITGAGLLPPNTKGLSQSGKQHFSFSLVITL